MSGHTPGPWRTNGDRYVEADDNLIVAKVEEFLSAQGRANQEANQRLIAAAPELLEALRPLATVAGLQPEWVPDNEAFIHWAGFAPITWGMAKAARTAIAKAEGRP